MREQIELETRTVADLKAGDLVIIYQDPFTKLKPEGTAILIKRIGEADPEEQRWRVKFEGEDECFERFIIAPFEVIGAGKEAA